MVKRMSTFLSSAYLLLAAAGLYAINFFYSLALSAPGADAETVYNLLAAGYYLLALAAPVVIFATHNEGSSLTLRLLPVTIGRGLLLIAAAFMGVMFVNAFSLVWYALIEALGGNIYASQNTLPEGSIFRGVLLIAVLPGVCEELLFRGAVLSSWERHGSKFAIVTSTLLFAFMHGSVCGLPSELIAGFALGFIVVKLGSVYAGMIFHTAYNATIYAMALYTGIADKSSAPIIEQLGGLPGLLSVSGYALFYGALFVLCLVFASRGGYKLYKPEKRAPASDWRTIVVLASALVTMAYPFILNIIEVFGA